ncbi:ricin-type beta-trefoil lectin domain protein [Kitasatospora sp. NPDC056327]|uniref:ricin-type beta-trefoil lectin domain protein n=1 Tax=Kitasatospora sp. NPDC056327 TaxID=3345785 RepID=UPI0035D8C2BC
MRVSRSLRRPGGPPSRVLAALCAAGVVLAAPGAAYADARASGDPVPVPTALSTDPGPRNPGDNACGGGTPGWIGRTTPLPDGTSDVRLSARAEGVPPGSDLRIAFRLWDVTAGEDAGSAGAALLTSGPVAQTAGTARVAVGRALVDGHRYGWNARSTAGGASSPETASCAFDVDVTAPTLAAVAPSTVFPPQGSGATPTGHAGDRGVTVRVTSKDPVPGGCPAGDCRAAGVREFQYALDDNIPVTGASRVAASYAADGTAWADVPISVGVAAWGSHRLNVRAVDGAGNTQPQAATYDFYAPSRPATPPVAGDVDLDGIRDFLAPAADGTLTLVRGGVTAPGVPETASPADRGPRHDDWNNYLVAHRGAASGQGDSLFAYHKTYKQLYIYLNDANAFPGGIEGRFTRDTLLVDDRGGMCDAGIDRTWDNVTQLTAVQRGTGRPGLITVENGHLRHYPGELLCHLGTGVELGAAGTDWSGYTLMFPGEVAGAPVLWVRDTVTGAVTALPLPLDAQGRTQSGFTPLQPPTRKPLVSALGGAGGVSMCADLERGWTGNGTRALLWNCAGQAVPANQGFTLGTDGSLHVLGKCLDVTGGATANGSPVNLWDCNGSAAQTWAAGPYPGTLRNPASGRCLDVPRADATAGNHLAIWDCHDGASERWTVPAAHAVLPLGLAAGAFPAVDSPGDYNADGYPDLVATSADGRLIQFRGTAPQGGLPRFARPQDIAEASLPAHNVVSVHAAGRCLDNYGASAGGSLGLYDCWNGENQKFAFAADGTLRTGGRCVTVRDDRTDWGAPAAIADCRGTGGQLWTYRASGEIYNPASNACLELPGWNAANGTVPGIWECNGNANQRWTLVPTTF